MYEGFIHGESQLTFGMVFVQNASERTLNGIRHFSRGITRYCEAAGAGDWVNQRETAVGTDLPAAQFHVEFQGYHWNCEGTGPCLSFS